MKNGPCDDCLVSPICKKLCRNKIANLCLEASKRKNKEYNTITYSDLLEQLNEEGLKKKSLLTDYDEHLTIEIY